MCDSNILLLICLLCNLFLFFVVFCWSFLARSCFVNKNLFSDFGVESVILFMTPKYLRY